MNKLATAFLVFISVQISWCQSYISEELFITSHNDVKISGTLLTPKKIKESLDIVIIIAGSGPTDRNGNSGMMTNNSLKYLAEGITKSKLATFRYDKRAVARSLHASISEKDLRFEDYVNDVVSIVEYFDKDERFNSITVLGHSEGSLVGMVASQKAKVDRFISVAGVGRTADQLLIDQLGQQYSKNKTRVILDSLKNGFLVKDLGKLEQLFRPSVQPYMISWFKYNPQVEIKKLQCPVLLLQGDNDIQVKVKELELLKEACPNAEFHLVSKMNHIMKIIKGDFNENMKSYYDPDLPISKEFLKKVVSFAKN